MTTLQLETAFLLYRKPVFDFCFVCLRCHQDAEDITMTLFMNLCKKREAIDFETVENYLMTSAKNRVVDLRRKRQYISRATLDIEDRTDNEALKRDEIKHLNRLINNLPPKMKESLKLRHIYGLSRSKIAEIMGVSPITARNNIAAGISKLKQFAKQL